MKRLIQFLLYPIIGLILLVSCEKEQALPNLSLCDNEYFYYANGSKVYFKQSLSQIFIEFKQDEITRELAKSVMSKYPFIDMNVVANSYKRVGVRINEQVSSCAIVNDYLEVLNEDDEIFSATPVFYLSDGNPDSYYILLSEVLTKNDDNMISESDFIDYAETMNLELVTAAYSTQHFKVKEVRTGFEALEIANQIYESEKVHYAQPNCIVKLELN